MKEVFLVTIPTMESVVFQNAGLFFSHSFSGVRTAQFDDMDGVEKYMDNLRNGKVSLPEYSRMDNMYMIFSECEHSKKSSSLLYLDKAVVQKVQRV